MDLGITSEFNFLDAAHDYTRDVRTLVLCALLELGIEKSCCTVRNSQTSDEKQAYKAGRRC